MLAGQIAASISDFLRVLTELLNVIIASYHQQIQRQQIFGYRLLVLHSFPLPLEIELLFRSSHTLNPFENNPRQQPLVILSGNRQITQEPQRLQ